MSRRGRWSKIVRRGLSMLPEYVQDPELFLRDLNRGYYLFTNPSGYNENGIDVPDEDWDNLLILDACRFDMFQDICTIPGKVERKTSCASMTQEWLEANFDGRDLTDTVYVTANPMYHRKHEKLDLAFHSIVDVWKEQWDDDVGTVRPEAVAEAALNAAERYPNKRLLIHFIQPHYPFIGDGIKFDNNGFGDSGTDPWNELFLGTLDNSVEEIWEAYRDNLRIILPEVESLCEKLSGKTVVSSDHGNMVGERSSPVPHKEYGHPPGLYTPKLVDVPWLTFDYDERKNVEKSGEADTVASPSKSVESRLEELGYVS